VVKSHENSMNNAISAIKREGRSRGRPKACPGPPRALSRLPRPPQAGQAAPGSRGFPGRPGLPRHGGWLPGWAKNTQKLDESDVPGAVYGLGQPPPRPSPGSRGLPAQPETRKNTRKLPSQAPSTGLRRPPPVVKSHENSINNAISTPLLAPQASRAGNPGKPGEALGAGLGRPGLGEPLGAPGGPWEPLGAPGSPWEPLGAPGSPWEPLGAPGSPWEPLGASGSPWEPLGVVFYRVFPCLEEV